MNKNIYILGVGRNTEVYIDLVEACGYNPAGLYHYNDERTGQNIHGIPVLDSNTNLFKKHTLAGMQFAISVGDNKIRAELANIIRANGGVLPTLIHPTAVVSKYATLSEGVVIHANSVVQAGARIGCNSVISYNASITHTSSIGENCYIASGSSIGAYVNIEDFVLIGQAAVLVSAKVSRIGENSIIGAGAVVTKSFESNTIVVGNPAREIKRR